MYNNMIVIHMHIYTYIFFRFFSIIGSYKILTMVPMLYGRSLLFVCFIYGSVSSYCLLYISSYCLLDVLFFKDKVCTVIVLFLSSLTL